VKGELAVEVVEANYVNYDFLRNLLSLERSQSGLELVKEDFFLHCGSFVAIQEGVLKESFSLEQARVLENSRKIMGELKDVRLRKILFKAFRDLEANAVNSSGLAKEEKEFYRSVLSLLSQYKQKGSPAEEKVKVKILVDLPEMQSPDGGAFGPFQRGAVAALSPATADLLAQKNAAEKI